MPVRIPVYQEQVAPQFEAANTRLPLISSDASAVSQGLESLGQGASKVGDVLQKQDDQDQQAALSKRIGDDTVNWLQYTQQAKDSAQPGAPDFTPSLLKNFDDYASQSLNNVPQGKYRDLYSMKLDQLRTTLAQHAITWQAEQHRAYNVDQYSQGSDSAARIVAMDPSQYGEQRATQLALINASSLDPQTKDKLSANFKDAASTAAGLRMVNDNPQAAYQVLTQKPDQPFPPGYEWVGDLPPQKLTVLQNHASMLVQQQQNAADSAALQRENDGISAYNKALDLVNQGKQLSPGYQTDLMSTTAGTSVAADTKSLVEQAAKNAGFSSLPLSAMRSAIQADQTDANTPGIGTDPATAAAVRQRQQIYTASEAAYKSDPWNAALDRGVIRAIPPVDTTSVQNLMQSLSARVAAAGPVENAAGRRVSLLTAGESSRALQLVQALPIEQQAQVLGNMGATFGQGGRIGDLAAQWKEKNPAVSLALKYGAMGAGGSPLLTQSGQPVGTFILSGQKAIADKEVKVDEMAGTGMKATIAGAIDGAMPPDQAADAKEAAYYIAIGNAVRNGRTQPNTNDIQNGINAATGGISTTGGVRFDGKQNHVAMPYGWHEDDFQNAVKTASPANIENTPGGKPIDTVYANGAAIPVADFMSKFSSYQLVRVGVRGTYAVSTGSKFVTDKTGRPVTVHLTLGQQNAPASGAPTPAEADASSTVPNPF